MEEDLKIVAAQDDDFANELTPELQTEIESGIQTEFNEDGLDELVEEGDVENVYSEN